MKCKNCDHNKWKVTDTRKVQDHIRRYRKCLNCSNKIITIEINIEEYQELIDNTMSLVRRTAEFCEREMEDLHKLHDLYSQNIKATSRKNTK